MDRWAGPVILSLGSLLGCSSPTPASQATSDEAGVESGSPPSDASVDGPLADASQAADSARADATADAGRPIDAAAPPGQDSGILEPALACDGVTNDTAALNTALQQASVSGATVLLPAGTCVVGGALPVHVPSNVILRGQGTTDGGTGTVLMAAPQITKCASNAGAVCALLQVGGDGQASASQVQLIGFAIDAGGFPDIGSAAIALNAGSSQVTIDGVSITNMPQYGIVVANADQFKITHTTIDKPDRPVNGSGLYTQIEAINVFASGPSTAGEISDCTFTGAGLDISASGTSIVDNTIQNWTFGSGITTEQSPYCHDLTISGNTVSGGIGLDVNQTVAIGIEQWCANTTVSNNKVFGNAGDGIDIGGQNDTVTSNSVYDNGTYAPGSFSGIVARWGDATYNANGAALSFNSSSNTAGASGPQLHGYGEQSAQLSGIVLFDCSLDTNQSSATSILSASTINSSLWASECTPGSGTCTSTITWSASPNASNVEVDVANGSNPTAFQPMAAGQSGQAQAPWIENMIYYFRLSASQGTLGTLTFQPQ